MLEIGIMLKKNFKEINIFMTQSLEKSCTVFCFFGASFCSCAFLLSSSTLTRISFSFKALIRAWYLTLTKSFTIFSGMSGNKLRMKLGVSSRILLPSFTLAPSLWEVQEGRLVPLGQAEPAQGFPPHVRTQQLSWQALLIITFKPS